MLAVRNGQLGGGPSGFEQSVTPGIRCFTEGMVLRMIRNRTAPSPALIAIAATLLSAAVALEASSRTSPFQLAIAAVVLVVLSLGWLLNLAAIWRNVRRKTVLALQLRGIIMLVVAAGTFGSVALDLPFKTRLALSRPAMDMVAAEILAGGTTERSWIGLWPVEHVEVFDGSMSFFIDGSGFMTRVGLAYSPKDAPPDPDGFVEYVDLGGGWWRWTESF